MNIDWLAMPSRIQQQELREGNMWRWMLLCVCTITGIGVLAGNRADINADQSVDALDLAELTNILAGNLDLAAYDLERVVVVAENGGDFNDPCDAADWVTNQGPTATTGYVILITPGRYDLDRTLLVPEYTTIKGYGDNVTHLKRSQSGVSGAVVTFSGPSAYQMRIEGVRMSNVGSSSSGPMIGVLVEDCYAEIMDCEIMAQSGSPSGDAVGIRVSRSTESTGLIIKNSSVTGTATATATGVGIGIEVYDALIYAYNSSLRATQLDANEYAYAVTVERSSVLPIFYAYQCDLSASADTGYDYYFYRWGAHGQAKLAGTKIDAGNLSNVSVGSDMQMVYCYDSTWDLIP